MSAAFTPGPWAVGRLHMVSARRLNVAQVITTNGDYEASAANSRLIAAAPDLYEAADRTFRSMTGDRSITVQECMEALEAALTKARGNA